MEEQLNNYRKEDAVVQIELWPNLNNIEMKLRSSRKCVSPCDKPINNVNEYKVSPDFWERNKGRVDKFGDSLMKIK